MSLETKRLNIFVDETGELSTGRRAAKLYGISLVFHESSSKIDRQLHALNQQLQNLGFEETIHMGELINGHGDFAGKSIAERKAIYLALYSFAKHIDAKYFSVFIDKKFTNNVGALKTKIRNELSELVDTNLSYFQQFSKIVLYYDAGQQPLSVMLDQIFGQLFGYNRKTKFSHKEKKLFQVADMLTYVDKLLYRAGKKQRLSKTEQRFFSKQNLKDYTKNMSKKRFGVN